GRFGGQLRPCGYHGGRGGGGEQDVLSESDVDEMGRRHGVLVGRSRWPDSRAVRPANLDRLRVITILVLVWGRRRAEGRGCRGSGPGFLRPWHDGHELVEEHLHCWHSPRGEGDPQVAAPTLIFGWRRRWRSRSCCCCGGGGSPPPAVPILGT
ncbi:unnamed protein product, partial [Ectocarpus sp. 13 AM-2016]